MTEHSARSPSTDGESALQRTLAETSSTVRAGMREALLEIANRSANFMDDDAADWMPSIYRIACEAVGEDPGPLLQAALQLPEAEIQWRHKKRGSTYTEVARGPLQASTRQPAEDDTIVCYRGADGRHFFREANEFEDGRFEKVSPGPSEANSTVAPVGDLMSLIDDLVKAERRHAAQPRDTDALFARTRLYGQIELVVAGHEGRAAFEKAKRIVDSRAAAPVDAGVREALEPFVRFSDGAMFTRLPDDFVLTAGSRLAHRQLTVGDFRKLRAALSSQPVVRVDQK